MKETRRIAGRWAALAACVGLALCAGWGSHLPSARAEARDPKGVAVVVGNRNYRNGRVPEVSYAHRDAAAFRRYVVEVLGYDRDNILYIEDADQARLESVFGNERSHEGLLWRYLDPEGGSDVVVFYSGHGVPGLKDKRSYLLPVNADPDTAEINGYPVDVLYGNLSKLREARSVRVFLDACFSGDSDRGMLVRAASPVYVKAELPEALRKLTVLTAASGQELASWDEKARHGLFTHHLLNALHGAADDARYGEKDGRVTASEAKRYLDRHMTRAARRTFGRHQRATLAGDEAAVLAAAVGEGFPARAEAESGSGNAPLVAVPKAAGKTSPGAAAPSPAAVDAGRRAREDKRPGRVFRDCSACPEMVVVPAGSYMMGSPGSEDGRTDAEEPVHRVTIGEPFAVGVYEVTFAEWDACVSDRGCGGYRPHDQGWGRGKRPVINVSWTDAEAYVSWLSAKTGKGYRLLSESEWEYVARAGTTSPFHFGSTLTTSQAKYTDRDRWGRRTAPVGSFPANAFGLHDVHGNVWERTMDCWNESYAGAPTDGSAWVSGDCRNRVVRGGGWQYGSRYVRSAHRARTHTGLDRQIDLGFRVARTFTP